MGNTFVHTMYLYILHIFTVSVNASRCVFLYLIVSSHYTWVGRFTRRTVKVPQSSIAEATIVPQLLSPRSFRDQTLNLRHYIEYPNNVTLNRIFISKLYRWVSYFGTPFVFPIDRPSLSYWPIRPSHSNISMLCQVFVS